MPTPVGPRHMLSGRSLGYWGWVEGLKNLSVPSIAQDRAWGSGCGRGRRQCCIRSRSSG